MLECLLSYMSIGICAINVTSLFSKNNKLKYKIFYVNVTYKPKTQIWAIYISYKHGIVIYCCMACHRNKDFTYYYKCYTNMNKGLIGR